MEAILNLWVDYPCTLDIFRKWRLCHAHPRNDRWLNVNRKILIYVRLGQRHQSRNKAHEVRVREVQDAMQMQGKCPFFQRAMAQPGWLERTHPSVGFGDPLGPIWPHMNPAWLWNPVARRAIHTGERAQVWSAHRNWNLKKAQKLAAITVRSIHRPGIRTLVCDPVFKLLHQG